MEFTFGTLYIVISAMYWCAGNREYTHTQTEWRGYVPRHNYAYQRMVLGSQIIKLEPRLDHTHPPNAQMHCCSTNIIYTCRVVWALP